MSRAEDHTTFVIIVLAAGFYWAHQALVTRIGRIALVVAIFIITLLCVVRVYEFIRKIRRWITRHNPNMPEVDSMTGLEFERYVAGLLKRNGYQHIRLTEKYDYGIDIIAVKDGFTWGIQVKRCSGLVKANAVRQVVTALRVYGCDKAVVVTNGTFSRIATKLAESNECDLIDRAILRTWIA